MPRKPPKKTVVSRNPPRHALSRKSKASVRYRANSAKPKTPKRRITNPVEAVVAEPASRGVGFPVVAMSVSAGGLEAFTQLLQRLPADTDMAFVLIQHLHPEYESALTEILSRITSMPVTAALDGMTIEPNHKAFQATTHNTLGNLPCGLDNGQRGIPQLRSKLENVTAHDATFDNFLITHAFEKIGNRTVAVSGQHIPSGPKTPPLVLMQIEDAAPSAAAAVHTD
jgi:CheB methylesterase